MGCGCVCVCPNSSGLCISGSLDSGFSKGVWGNPPPPLAVRRVAAVVKSGHCGGGVLTF